MTSVRAVSVLLPMPLKEAYDYIAPEEMDLKPGDFVSVPLGPREMRAVVWRGPEGYEPKTPVEKLKPVRAKFDAPPLAPDVLDFIEWVARYTVFPPGAVLRMTMRSGQLLDPPPMESVYALTEEMPSKLTPQRARVLEAAKLGAMTARSLAEAAGSSDAVVRGLEKVGALRRTRRPTDAPFPEYSLSKDGVALSEEQSEAAAAIRARIEQGGYSATLLDGVTGSGKTEVYFDAVAETLKRDPTAQVLVLLPEIALTLQFINRVEERFGALPALWHSDISQTERRRVWRGVLDGSARFVAGARSALFLPYRNLRLIIVDEEHDAAFKQEDGVLYHARDMAVARAARAKFPILLASATPSLETALNARDGRYETVRLTGRFGGALMPETDAIDMRETPPEKGRWLSPPMVEAVQETLDRGEQAMLFLNRRGYAPLTICRRCGHRMTAPDSDTWLVEHRYENRLVCHHTGFSMPKPDICPECQAPDSLTACGPGVERVAEEAAERFPEARLAVFSSDTVASPQAAQTLLAQMRAHEIDLLVGTQVVAKGHHFPDLTLVGVVDADLGLQGGDLRAGERTFQLLNQVAGRAGRESRPGRALLQSYRPDHPVIQALVSGDREAFLQNEALGREMFSSPPFGRWAALVLSAEDDAKLSQFARDLAGAAPIAEGVEVWGPAPAPLSRLRGRSRIRFLAKAQRNLNLQSYLRAWLGRVKTPANVRLRVDVDPYSFL